jgi:hypothetical protein
MQITYQEKDREGTNAENGANYVSDLPAQGAIDPLHEKGGTEARRKDLRESARKRKPWNNTYVKNIWSSRVSENLVGFLGTQACS